MAQPAAAFRGILTLALGALFIAIDSATLQLAFGQGLFEVLRATFFWIVYFSVAYWIAGLAWRAIGPNAQSALARLAAGGKSALRLSLLSLIAAIVIGSSIYALRPTGEARYAGESWRVASDPQSGMPVTVPYPDAAALCSETERLLAAADLEQIWAELQSRQLKMSVWIGNGTEDSQNYVRLMGNRYEFVQLESGDNAPIHHMQVICMQAN